MPIGTRMANKAVIGLLLMAASFSVSGADQSQRRPGDPSPGLLANRPLISRDVSMDEAVAIALRESPVLRGSEAELDAAAARLKEARAELRPWASVNGFLSDGNNPAIVSTPPATQPGMTMALSRGRFSDANLMVMYPLFTGGRLGAMVRHRAALRDATQADLESVRQEVALMTRTAYRESIARRSLVDVATARLREDEERLRQDQERLKQEQVPSYYIQRDLAEVAATRQEVTNAQRDADIALVQLKTVMGISPDSDISVRGPLAYVPSSETVNRLSAGSVDPASGGKDGQLRALLQAAERNRPELRAADGRLTASSAETSSARAAFAPQASLFATADLMKEEGMGSRGGATVGAVVSWPLFNGGQRRARVEVARAEERRQSEELNRLALQVSQEVTTALLNLRAAEQNVETAQAALTSARAEYEAAQKRYEVGRSVIVEVLDAIASRVRAETNVVQSFYEFNTAKDQLRRAVGDPSLLAPAGSSAG